MTEYLPMCLSRFLLMYGNAHIGQPLNIMMVSNCLMTALAATVEVMVRLILKADSRALDRREVQSELDLLNCLQTDVGGFGSLGRTEPLSAL